MGKTWMSLCDEEEIKHIKQGAYISKPGKDAYITFKIIVKSFYIEIAQEKILIDV